MALAIAVSLVGAQDPQAVLITVTGATTTDTYTVTGTWSGTSWIVRGGDSTLPTGTQILLVDVASPINVPIVYQVTHDADQVSVNSSPITASLSTGNRYVISTIDGITGTPFIWMNNNDPLTTPMRTTLFYVPGRPSPVVRYDVPNTDVGTLQILTENTQTDVLQEILAQGGLVMLRTDGTLLDFPAVQFMLVTDVTRTLPGNDTERIWNLSYVGLSDPIPNTVVAVDVWDDFDSAYSLLTWTSFDTEWSTLTWDKFDAVDWATR